MDENEELDAMLVHGRLAELHKLAMEWNKRHGSLLMYSWHKLCIKIELYAAKEHFKALKKRMGDGHVR